MYSMYTNQQLYKRWTSTIIIVIHNINSILNLFLFSVMQQSAAEKDRARTGMLARMMQWKPRNAWFSVIIIINISFIYKLYLFIQILRLRHQYLDMFGDTHYK